MKKYIKQYRTETTRNEKNKKVRRVIYTGDYYEVKKEKAKRESFLASAAAFLALHFAVGILNTPSSRVFYVALPYTVLFLPGVYFLMGAFSFLRAGKKMEFPTYEKSVVRMKRSLLGLVWGLGYLAAAETVFLFLNVSQAKIAGGELFREMVFLMVCAVNLAQIFRNKKNVNNVDVVEIGSQSEHAL
ncbi:MAG: hypothetical protein SO016_08140 [Lachnospiraceae bacterium]|nr:hypothetical protein [Robinsoniella sp.]MDY3766643.1 hypothetical protein [Lachnospiraceae bacterium]